MAVRFNLFLAGIRRAFYRLKVAFLFQFRLKPRINRMKRFVSGLVSERADCFPRGKSLFVFSGKDDNLYFIVLKEDPAILVTEVFDDILNKVPDRYQILPKVLLQDILVRPSASPL
jgi:hypothetical protein